MISIYLMIENFEYYFSLKSTKSVAKFSDFFSQYFQFVLITTIFFFIKLLFAETLLLPIMSINSLGFMLVKSVQMIAYILLKFVIFFYIEQRVKKFFLFSLFIFRKSKEMRKKYLALSKKENKLLSIYLGAFI